MSSSLSLCPLWALWFQETRFWGSWQSSDFGTLRNPAKITEQVRVTRIQMQMSPVPGSQAHGGRFPLCSDPRGPLPTLLRSLISCFHVSLKWLYRFPGLPWRLSCNKSACSAGDMGSIPESGRCPPGKPMDRGAWCATVHGFTKSDTTEWWNHHRVIIKAIYILLQQTLKNTDN